MSAGHLTLQLLKSVFLVTGDALMLLAHNELLREALPITTGKYTVVANYLYLNRVIVIIMSVTFLFKCIIRYDIKVDTKITLLL